MLVTRRQKADSTGTAYAGLHPQEVELRLTRIFLQPGIDFFSASFLDAGVYQQKIISRFPAIRTLQSWLPH